MTNCECTSRFTCRYCCENAKPYFWTPNPVVPVEPKGDNEGDKA